MKRKKHKKKQIPPFSTTKFMNRKELYIFCDYIEGRRVGINDEILNLQSVEHKKLRLICEILLTTGLRACELCRLKVMDTPVVREEPEIFVDPINNSSFVYKLTDDGFKLYSKGKNNIDENGEFKRSGPDDWPIWPPPSKKRMAEGANTDANNLHRKLYNYTEKTTAVSEHR